MGNPNTGEIYELAEGESPRPGDVELSQDEALKLMQMELEQRKRELRNFSEQRASVAKSQQVENAFTYHAPKDNQPERYTQIREAAKGLALLIDAQCPNSREKSLALTNLEQAIMWANASIARNE